MKKLLLLTGLIVSVTVAALTEDRFKEFFEIEDSLLRAAGLATGCISCDVINQLSQEERDIIKRGAYIRASRSFDAYEVLISTVLYNNIKRCEDQKETLLWPRDFVNDSQIRQLEHLRLEEIGNK